MAFNQFPYSNLHELNLDWILNKIRELESEWNTFTAINHIVFRGDWNITLQYPAYSVVKDNNNGYFAIQPVPKGVAITNTDYWIMIYDYDQLAAELEQRMTALETEFDELTTYVDSKAALMMSYDWDAQRSAFTAGVLPIIADYLTRAYGGNCLTTPDNTLAKIVVVYDNQKTYAGWLGRPTGRNTYVGTDTRQFNGVNYPVVYLDCSTFVNLLTCGRDYEHTLNYFTTNNNGNTDIDYPGANFKNLIWMCSENDDDSWVFDWHSNILTPNMLRLMDNCGNAGTQIQKLENGVKTRIVNKISALQTGDILFGGRASSENYKNIIHCAIFIKSLDDLDNVKPGHGFKTYNNTTDPDGYIVEVGAAKGGTDYQDVVRITTLSEFLATFDTAYSVFPMSSVETSSRKKMYYDRTFTCWRFKANYAPLFGTVDSIRFFIPSTLKNIRTRTANLLLTAGTDLNDIFDDLMECGSSATTAALVNKPAEVASGGVILKTYAPSWTGVFRVQELYNFPLSGTSGAIKVYRRYCTFDNNWSEWVEV